MSDRIGARQGFTRARPGRELQLPRPSALTLASRILGLAAGASCDDLASALVLAGGDTVVDALAAAADWEPSAVVVPHAFLLRAAKAALPGVPLVYDCHNVEAALKEGMYRDTPHARRLAAVVDALEQEMCDEAALVVACAEEDRIALHERFGLPLDRCAVVPNGVAVRDAQFVSWAERRRRAPRCVFAGSDHPPNTVAAREIVAAARALPHVGFDVVGTVCANLTGPLPPNVVAHGRVSDEQKQQLYATATLALNPMHGGSGSNLKIVDYAAAGIPVVTTAFGARGFVDELVETFERYDGGAAELADAVSAALSQDWTERTVAARAVCEHSYDWPVLARRYAEILLDRL